MVKRACDAILFDLDGVLIDSTSCITRHWKNWAKQHNLDTEKIMEIAHGRQTIDTIHIMAPNLDAEQEAEQFTAGEVADTSGVLVMAGANRLLNALPGDAWAIVTSASLALARARLARTKLPVPQALVTAEDTRTGKPALDPYLAGTKRLGVEAGRCIVVEDAPAGVEAGKRAGMWVIGVATTHRKADLFDAGANIVIESLNQLRVEETGKDYRLFVSTG